MKTQQCGYRTLWFFRTIFELHPDGIVFKRDFLPWTLFTKITIVEFVTGGNGHAPYSILTIYTPNKRIRINSLYLEYKDGSEGSDYKEFERLIFEHCKKEIIHRRKAVFGILDFKSLKGIFEFILLSTYLSLIFGLIIKAAIQLFN